MLIKHEELKIKAEELRLNTRRLQLEEAKAATTCLLQQQQAAYYNLKTWALAYDMVAKGQLSAEEFTVPTLSALDIKPDIFNLPSASSAGSEPFEYELFNQGAQGRLSKAPEPFNLVLTAKGARGN